MSGGITFEETGWKQGYYTGISAVTRLWLEQENQCSD